MSKNLVPAYRYDGQGFYIGAERVQEGILPPDDTLTEPELKNGYWSKWSGKKWTQVKKPTTAAECVGLSVKHEDNSAHAVELKALFKALCEADSAHYRVATNGELMQTVEAVPEDTTAEKALDTAEASASTLDSQISELKEQMALAQLLGDADMISEIQASYKTLIEEA